MVYNDYYWLNEDSRLFLSRGYLAENISPEKRIRDIAETAEKLLKKPGFADKFESYMKAGFYSLATPIWTNFGNKRGLPISCFGSYIDDTIDSILTKTSEVGTMSKYGGGTSGFFGDLRPRGSKISVGGESSGPIHFMEIFDKVAEVISQGSARRGSFAAYLPIEHADIEEFLKIKSDGHSIQNISIGVTITDKFMNEMIDGDNQKRDIWAKLIQKRFETGYPYIVFIDNVNNNAPQVYKDLGLKVKASNLCVTGNQRVPSNKGLLTAKALYELGDNLKLFDNKKIVESSPMKLIEKNADVYKITLDNGMTHTVTKYHKVCIFNSLKVDSYTKNIECQDLKIGDRVAIQTAKGVFGPIHMPKEAFLLGLYHGDGTQHDNTIMFDIWQNDFDLENEIKECHDYICDNYNTQYSASRNRRYNNANFVECIVAQSKVRKRRLASNAVIKAGLGFKKGYIPEWVWGGNEKTQWQYIRGLLYTDGTVYHGNSKGNPLSIALSSIDKDHLQNIQIILSNLGIQSTIRILRKAGKTLLPNGKGGYDYYNTKDCWRLIIGNKNDAIVINDNTGFLDRKKIKLDRRKYRDNTKKFYKILSIEYVGKEDVYCCTVDSDEHLWICNGFITHNCSEILLFSDIENSFVCDLSSLNLLRWDAIAQTDAIETLVYFLDAVMTEFINKSKKIRYMEAARNFAERQRALGIGVLGWHSYLQSKMIGFESMAAKHKNNEIWKIIRERCDNATKEMAAEYGEPELLKGYGIRNVTTLAVAPTTSSSFILGQVSPSIEPLNSNYFVKNLAKGKFTYKNPYLIEVLNKYDQNNDDIWKKILISGGSVQNLDFLNEKEKDVFKTFGEISQKEIIIQAAQRQKYIDQGQSLNIMIPPKTSPKDVSTLLIDGWKMGIKTFYYQRSANPAQELVRNILSCSSCEA